jgi:predicted ester cyclase
VHARTIADCVCKGNRIVHEWLVRDQAAIALQIGSTPRALAQQWLEQRGGWHKPLAGPAPQGYLSHISADPMALAYARAIEAFSARDYAAAAVYDDAAQHIGPGERLHYGHAEIADFWRSLFAALRVTGFEVEHLAMQRDMARSGRPDRLALRFRAQSVHEPVDMDATRFGKGTGRPVELLGIVHAEFVQGRVLREWVLLDEVAIWMQILNQRA